MGCCGQRDKPLDERQKWDYITLAEFKSTSHWEIFSYIWLWILAIISVAVFVVDCYICVNLLAFDKFSSTIQPTLPLKYAKWIFAVCILISVILYGYEWQRCIRVMRRGSVAESYMDRIAAKIQCMRGKGWKRFLVFSELTKHRKGADYVALFTHFQFSSAARVIFAEAGRQVVNANTLWFLTQSNLLPGAAHATSKESSPFIQFWDNLGGFFRANNKEGIVFCSMLFTLVIFVFSALSLLAAVILYITFLWHYVPSSDGRLANYCKRKIDKRLTKIVGDKVKADVSSEKIQSIPTDKLDFEKGGVKRQPTLPDLDVGDMKSPRFGLVRDDTSSSLHSYGSKSSSPTKSVPTVSTLRTQPSLPNIEPGTPLGAAFDTPHRPQFPARSDTMNSSLAYSMKSFEANAPLLRNANGMGYSEPAYPMQPMQSMPRGPTPMAMAMPYQQRPPPGPRSNTPGSIKSFVSGPPPPMPYASPAPSLPQAPAYLGRSYTGGSTYTTNTAYTGTTSMSSGPEGYVSAPINRSATATPAAVELPSGPRSVAGRSMAATMSTYSTNTNGEDSFTRMITASSFNRPFNRSDIPAVPAINGTHTASNSQSNMYPPPLRPQADRGPRNETYAPFMANDNSSRVSNPFNSSNTNSYAGPPARRNMTTPGSQMQIPAQSQGPPYRGPPRSFTDPNDPYLNPHRF